jgi:hypothetical protein
MSAALCFALGLTAAAAVLAIAGHAATRPVRRG